MYEEDGCESSGRMGGHLDQITKKQMRLPAIITNFDPVSRIPVNPRTLARESLVASGQPNRRRKQQKRKT